MKFSIKDFFSKCDQIRWYLQIWSHLLKKSLMENFIFCVVFGARESYSTTTEYLTKSSLRNIEIKTFANVFETMSLKNFLKNLAFIVNATIKIDS